MGATEGMLGVTGLGPNVGVPPLSDGAMPDLVAPGWVGIGAPVGTVGDGGNGAMPGGGLGALLGGGGLTTPGKDGLAEDGGGGTGEGGEVGAGMGLGTAGAGDGGGA